MPVDLTEFRRLFGFCPTGVTVVTTLDGDTGPCGFTCSSVVSVSALPPLLLICVDKDSRSLPALLKTRRFVVNVLAEGSEQLARTFAGRSDRKFAGLPWRSSARLPGVPVLDHAVCAYAECLVVRTIEAGDHWVLIAQVEGTGAFPRRPLLYHRGEFSVWSLT